MAETSMPLRIVKLTRDRGETLASLRGAVHPRPHSTVHLADGRRVRVSEARAGRIAQSMLARMERRHG